MRSEGISVVIPAYNEERYLPETIASIDQARRAFEAECGLPSEIVVVDNDSNDGTASIAEGLGARVIAHPVRNIAAVRNAGIAAAGHALVVTIDADSRIPADALVRIWREMQTGKYVGGGVRVDLETDRWVLRALLFVMGWMLRLGEGVSGGMFFFWAEAARAVGGFPEDRLIAEDVAFAKRLRRHGKTEGKRFCNLFAVTLRTLDRKNASLSTTLRAFGQALRQMAGRKLSREELGYWYDPDR